MNQELKDWIDALSKVAGGSGLLITALSYRNGIKTKRAEWLKELFVKFYENDGFKDIRKLIEEKKIENLINTKDGVVSDVEEKFADYLNFFEFIATLKSEGNLKKKDVLNLFDYYLRRIKTSPACMSWVDKKDYGFENLRTLLKEVR